MIYIDDTQWDGPLKKGNGLSLSRAVDCPLLDISGEYYLKCRITRKHVRNKAGNVRINVILRRFSETIVAMQRLELLHTLSVCF